MNKNHIKTISIVMITFVVMSVIVFSFHMFKSADALLGEEDGFELNTQNTSSNQPDSTNQFFAQLKVNPSNLNMSVKKALDLQKELNKPKPDQKNSEKTEPKPSSNTNSNGTDKTKNTTNTPVPLLKDMQGTTEPIKSIKPLITMNPFKGQKLYIDPLSYAKLQADSWRLSRPQDALQIDKIATNSMAKWMGDWNINIEKDVNEYVTRVSNTGSLPVLVPYNIPIRDCNSYSAGGAASEASYREWIKAFDKGIGNNKAVVILEPDALAGMDCLSQPDQDKRLSLLKDAVEILKMRKTVSVYVDAGNSNWISVADMANRLQRIGINKADGFALNVSNFYANTSLITYGKQVSSLVGDKHFVIDTSRNGLSQSLNYSWCNPSNRALGDRPTVSTGHPLVDAYLWIKNPGESDGTCNGGPSAGVWWPEYALGLAQRAGY